MRTIKVAAIALALLACGVAQADQPQTTVGGTTKAAVITPVVLGTSPQLLLVASPIQINELLIDNESASATIAICFAPPNALPSVACPNGPSLNTAGSFTIPPGASRIWGTNGGNVPSNAIWGIASAANAQVTIERE